MSSPITFRHPAMREICEVLGFKNVRSMHIGADLNSPVVVTVECLVMDDEAGQILRVIKDHNLIADDGATFSAPEALESGDDATTVEDDNRKYKR